MESGGKDLIVSLRFSSHLMGLSNNEVHASDPSFDKY